MRDNNHRHRIFASFVSPSKALAPLAASIVMTLSQPESAGVPEEPMQSSIQAGAGGIPRKNSAPLSKRQKAERLIELTKVAELVLDGIKTRIRLLPLPEESMSRLEASATLDGLVEALVPVYERNLTEEELDAAIEFHMSPHGRAMSEKQKDIYQDTQGAINEWFDKVAGRVKP